jgi:hypothetical protein
MPSPRIGFVPLLLAPLALLTAACVHTGGSASVHAPPPEATPATPAPVGSPAPPSAPAPSTSPPSSPAASPVSPASAGPAAAAPSAASGTARTAPPATKRPPPGTGAAPRTQPPATAPAAAVASTAAPASAKPAAPAAAALDLNGLEQRLRDTRAIGVFTKLSLKNQVDDLLTEFRTYHKGRTPPTLTQLRQQYEVLLMKVVTLLQDGDPSLAGAVTSSREAIWGVLTDPVKFANI